MAHRTKKAKPASSPDFNRRLEVLKAAGPYFSGFMQFLNIYLNHFK